MTVTAATTQTRTRELQKAELQLRSEVPRTVGEEGAQQAGREKERAEGIEEEVGEGASCG